MLAPKMHDDGVLELINSIILNNDKIILYNDSKLIDDTLQAIQAIQSKVLYDADFVRNAQTPNWKIKEHKIHFKDCALTIPEIICDSIIEGTEVLADEESLEDLNSYLFFISKRISSKHLRIVIPDDCNTRKIFTFVRDKGFDNIQRDFKDLILRKQTDPQMVVAVIRENAKKDETYKYISSLIENCAQNYIFITINSFMNQAELYAAQNKYETERTEAKYHLEDLLVNLPYFQNADKSLLRYDTLYKFVPQSFDEKGYIPTPDDRDVRSLVSHIKGYGLNDVNAPYVESLADIVDRSFGEYKKYLTLFCVPSSRKLAYTTKFEKLSTVLATKCGMDNSFSHIKYIKDFIPSESNRKGFPTLSYDKDYFRDRLILIFDELIYTGNSSLHYLNIIKELGAKPIMLLAVAKIIEPE